MPWSKTTRICVMMALDTVFLAIELGVGYWVQSLALVADAFHMLNDIISLAVGLWAVNLARKESTDRYSYGWLRAEILGAFFNATFLIGLCLTIVLEAIQRFFDPPEITNPQVILIVGAFGLASNLVGFWVLGGHGHSHGPGDLESAEGHSHEHSHGESHAHGHSHSHDHVHGGSIYGSGSDDGEDGDDHYNEENTIVHTPAADEVSAAEQGLARRPESSDTGRHISFDEHRHEDLRSNHYERSTSRASARSRASAGLRSRANSGRRVPTSIDDISIHPASFRQDILIAARESSNIEEEEEDEEEEDEAEEERGDSDASTVAATNAADATETTPLIGNSKTQYGGPATNKANKTNSSGHGQHDHHEHSHAAPTLLTRPRRDSHGGHHHNAPRDASKGHGHSHGDMGMNAMVLHVMGDALGNIGVIVTALIIWKTTSPYRFYADPVVSLLITLIILKTAIPLTKATSKILLQATPDHIDINDIREDIQDLDGVLSCHHIHVWQLSDSQIIASMHIEVSFPISEYGGEKYMALAKRVRKCLHAYSIHSATIQPEFRVVGANTSTITAGAGAANDVDGRGRSVPASPTASPSISSPVLGTGAGCGAASASSAATTAAAAAGPAPSSSLLATTPSGLAASDLTDGAGCLLDCVDNCVGRGCCQVTSRNGSRTGSPPNHHNGHDDHSHAH